MDIKTRIKRHDWMLNIVILIFAFASVMTIKSVAPELLSKQMLWFVIGFSLLAFVSLVDVRPLINYRWIIFGVYFTSIALLVVTLLVAPTIRGVKGWIPLGPLQFQTSELAKIILLGLLAYFFAHRHVRIAHAGNILVSFIYTAIPAALVLMQPDWGSAFVFFALWMIFLLLSGLRMKHLTVGLILIVLVSVISWSFFLQEYQKERIIGFVRPDYDPLGVNYSVIQAKIAIGSAGLFGKGFGQGTQAQLGFLPESATDFIFAAFIEEWGIVGGVVMVGLFIFLLLRILLIGWRARDNFGTFVCLGTAFMFLIEFFLNVGSNLGLVPVVGVTFPLFSYGGSSILTKSLLIGIIQSINTRSSF